MNLQPILPEHITVSPQMLETLGKFNYRWQKRRDCFSRYTGGGWWGRGTVISPEMRGWYNSFLPPDEYRRDLLRLGHVLLGGETFIPYSLLVGGDAFMSLPDLWATLEDTFAGKTSYVPDELLALFCNLAEPSRMGTAVGRYPEQIERLVRYLKGKKHTKHHLRILDLGCGTGLGTYELAQVCHRHFTGKVTVRGVTTEALEVWMATFRKLPHTPLRQRQYPRDISGYDVDFRRGYAESYRDECPCDIIVCNGLAGGRFLNSTSGLTQFLECCRCNLSPHGSVMLSNHFHEGYASGCQRLMTLARHSGWHVDGDWRNLELTI